MSLCSNHCVGRLSQMLVKTCDLYAHTTVSSHNHNIPNVRSFFTSAANTEILIMALWWLFFVTWSSSSDSSECFKTRKKPHVNLAFLAASYLIGVQVAVMLEIRYTCKILKLVIILWLVLLPFWGVGFSLYESLILIFLVSAFLNPTSASF